MTIEKLTLAAFYDGWQNYNAILANTVRNLSSEQLALRPAPGQWAIWQLVAHLAGARAYWFGVMKERTEEIATFGWTDSAGWEDDEDNPREPDELARALDETWKLIEGCLRRWTPEMLSDEFSRQRNGQTQTLTRQSIIWRIVAHDNLHTGEVSLIMGMHGLPSFDFWTPPHPPAASASGS